MMTSMISCSRNLENRDRPTQPTTQAMNKLLTALAVSLLAFGTSAPAAETATATNAAPAAAAAKPAPAPA